jgi:acyl carrier protein
VTKINDYDEFYAKFRVILSDLLILKEEEIKPGSLLLEDLDADSISFLELSFLVEESLGVKMPEVKVTEELLTKPLASGLEMMEAMGGDATFFEHVEKRAVGKVVEEVGTARELAALFGVAELDGIDPETPTGALRVGQLGRVGLPGDWSDLPGELTELTVAEAVDRADVWQVMAPAGRKQLLDTQTVGDLSRNMECGIPSGLQAETPLAELTLQDLFRFLTVSAMASYLWGLREGAAADANP